MNLPRNVVPGFLLRLMIPSKTTNLQYGPEDQIAHEFATRLRTWALQGQLYAVWFHVPNEIAGQQGSRRAAIRYALAKAIGLIPGTADFIFLCAAGSFALECKAGRNTLSANQKDFRDWCELVGVPFAVFRSADEGEAQLRAWGILR